MKTLFLFLISALILTTGCLKKGEDDPVLSLRSRTARLTGEWHLRSGYADIVETTAHYSYTFDGTTCVRTILPENISETFGHTQIYTFDKKGGFHAVTTIDGETTSIDGEWQWEEGKGKKKQLYLLFLGRRHYVKQLTNREMVLTFGSSDGMENNSWELKFIRE